MGTVVGDCWVSEHWIGDELGEGGGIGLMLSQSKNIQDMINVCIQANLLSHVLIHACLLHTMQIVRNMWNYREMPLKYTHLYICNL